MSDPLDEDSTLAARSSGHAAGLPTLPGYELLDELGRGGMGVVYRARQLSLGRIVALKMVLAGRTAGPRELDRFRAEARVLGRLQHPHIVQVYDFGESAGLPWLALEYCPHGTLAGRLKPGPLPPTEAAATLASLADAIEATHAKGVIHRDLKPGNVLVAEGGVLKVADFGLVRDGEGNGTISGAVMGTPAYMAPEQARGERVGPPADLWALGAILYECLTGRPPVTGPNQQSVLAHLIVGRPIPGPRSISPAVPARLDAVCRRCLEYDPAARFASAAALAADLREFLARPDAPVRPHAAAPPALEVRRPALLRPPDPPPEETGPGVVRPALVVGIGGAGLAVLQRLRQALTLRAGLTGTPAVRLLYVDTDPDRLDPAVPPAGLSAEEVFAARLTRAASYLRPRRNGQSLIEGWFEQQLLYRIPRNPVTLGCRAFGRLALCDHFRALGQRIRHELEACRHPDAIAATIRGTGLGLRTNRPRAYVVASAAGGTGSGMLIDLAYLLRDRLRHLGHEPDVAGVLLLPPTGTSADANAFATLAELRYFSAAGADGPAAGPPDEPVRDPGPPLTRLAAVTATGPAPADLAACATRAGDLIVRELLSPLGRAVDGPVDGVACIVPGSFRLASPTAAIRSAVARGLTGLLLGRWIARISGEEGKRFATWADAQAVAFGLVPEAVAERLRAEASLDDTLADTWLDGLPRPLTATPIEATLDLLAGRVGRPDVDPEGPRRPAFCAALDAASATLAQETRTRLSEVARHFAETPGAGPPACEFVVGHLAWSTSRRQEDLLAAAASAESQAEHTFQRLIESFRQPRGLFRRGPSHADVLAMLRGYVRLRLRMFVARAAAVVFRVAHDHLAAHLREFGRVRGLLEEAIERWAILPPEADAGGPDSRILLPAGLGSVADAADAASDEDLIRFETALHARLRPAGGLDRALSRPGMVAAFLGEVLAEAEAFTTGMVPATDAAGVLLDRGDTAAGLEKAHAAATPSTTGKREECVVVLPDSEAGRTLREVATAALPAGTAFVAGGTDEVLLYREARLPALSALPHLGPAGRAAAANAANSPFSRIDIDWQAAGE